MVGKVLRRVLVAETAGRARVVAGALSGAPTPAPSTPASCSAARMRAASSAAPGVSPWTQMVSTVERHARAVDGHRPRCRSTIATARATTASASSMTTPPGCSRGTSVAVGADSRGRRTPRDAVAQAGALRRRRSAPSRPDRTASATDRPRASARAIASASDASRAAMLYSAPCGLTCCSRTPCAAAIAASAPI